MARGNWGKVVGHSTRVSQAVSRLQRKAARTCGVLATKALACKLAKAAWHVMSGNVAYDAARVFGRVAESQGKGLVQDLQD
jgi:hypothetical protein